MNYTSDDILKQKFESFTLVKGSKASYKIQLENKLNHLSEVWQSTLPLKEMSYIISEEYADVVIAELDANGDIKVFSR